MNRWEQAVALVDRVPSVVWLAFAAVSMVVTTSAIAPGNEWTSAPSMSIRIDCQSSGLPGSTHQANIHSKPIRPQEGRRRSLDTVVGLILLVEVPIRSQPMASSRSFG
jgi:hypothetical protein